MATGAQSFYSTPAFELFRRGLVTQTIKTFRGINAFQSQTLLTPDWALDCMNVMVPGWGGLSKFRLPVRISPGFVPNGQILSFFDFQQGNGTRQVVVNDGNSLHYFTWDAAGVNLTGATLIETAANDAPPWSMVEANNVLFGANGQRMQKWTGTGWFGWGIVAPATAPTFGVSGVQLSSIQRAANVVTFTLKTGGIGSQHNSTYFAVGDLVTITEPSDATFNGTFAIASIVTPGLTYTYAQVAANSGPFADGLIAFITSSGVAAGVTAVRAGGVAVYTFPQPFPSSNFVGTLITVSGFADATFNGTFIVTAETDAFSAATTLSVSQVGQPDTVPAGTGTITCGITATTGRTIAYAFQGVTGAVSNISPTAFIAGPFTNRIIYVKTAAALDPQVTGALFFATLDGGGDLFVDGSGGIVQGGLSTVISFSDSYADASLDKTRQGPLINNPPPVGKYLAVGQSRVFVANLVGASVDIAYSGYEQILIGRPEESFPPFNRLHLSIGAESVFGIGIIQAGIVAFSATRKIWMLRGQVEDISISAPVQFSAFLEELPWNMGTMCHQSIQSTPYGLMFWATDKTVCMFDGTSKPQDISGPVHPILRRATPGTEVKASSAYFNWLDRDWYGLSFAIDGSAVNNYVIFWALNDATSQIDIFPCSVQMDSLGTLTTSKLQRILAVSQAGQMFNLPVAQDTRGGIGDLSVIPATNGLLGAFWQSGYFGNDMPYRSKMQRKGLLVTDQDGFEVTLRFVNNRTNTVTNPRIDGPKPVKDQTFGMNWRSARVSVEINFPEQDVSCNVLELSAGAIATSDR